jgi:DTW domain-containing protein YfiP
MMEHSLHTRTKRGKSVNCDCCLVQEFFCLCPFALAPSEIRAISMNSLIWMH